VSRSRAQELIDSGAVRLKGRRLKKGDRLEAGSVLEVQAEPEGPAVVPQPEIPLVVLLETPSLIVLDKPAGVACHPLRPGETGTLANALVARFPECLAAGAAPREAGLCHRLDRETSGAILAARTPEAFRALREEFRKREVEKVYLGLVEGKLQPPEGRIELALGGRGSRTRPWRGPGDGRELPALTSYRTLSSAGDRSLLEVRIETGVRYQIRAHLAALGHPLVGDVAYGGAAWPLLPRHLLHAWRLGFRDPADGTRREARAPLPEDARRALEQLGFGPHLD
jgi:23S rRNA pseudouridine1911/1915/1917 synthase